jgi:hypothetical protein
MIAYSSGDIYDRGYRNSRLGGLASEGPSHSVDLGGSVTHLHSFT